MKIWERHSVTEIARCLEQEIAKAQNELNCAQRDLDKVKKRLAFSLSAVHGLQNKDKQE